MVEQVGYKRNIMASGLRTNKTNTIGLIVPRISMFVHTEIITTIQNGLHGHGYNLIICRSNDSLDIEKDLAADLVRLAGGCGDCSLYLVYFGL